MKIKEFEQKIGMRVEGLNEERFIEILKNPEFKKLFDSPLDPPIPQILKNVEKPPIAPAT